MIALSLNPAIDRIAVAAAFARDGRVHIPELLPIEQARAVGEHLAARSDWRLRINGGDTVFDIARTAFDDMDPVERMRIEQAIHQAATHGFQFRFDSVRVPDGDEERRAADTLLDRFARFLCEPAQRAFLAEIVGGEIGFVDAQASRYTAGDFLTGHDDDVAGKHRVAAYVFGLTERWRPEWGGLLAFHGNDGHIERAFTPGFNSLNLFAVPQTHSVSMVTPFAARPRLAITGWARRTSP